MGGGGREIEVKEKLVKLNRNRCEKIEYITNPYTNDSQSTMDGWLVSSCTDVPTQNAKSLTPIIEVGERWKRS